MLTETVHVRMGRIREQAEISEFLPHLVHEDDQDPKQFLTSMQGMMETRREQILVLGIRREDKLVGFSISLDLLRPYVWITQFWMDPTMGQKVTDEMFLRILNWAVALGKVEVRAETTRSVDAFYRRVGFEQHSVTVKLKLSGIEEKLLDRAREVFKDG